MPCFAGRKKNPQPCGRGCKYPIKKSRRSQVMGGLDRNRTRASRFCLAEPDPAPQDRPSRFETWAGFAPADIGFADRRVSYFTTRSMLTEC